MPKVRVSKHLKGSFDNLPINASAAMRRAVVNASTNPDLLVNTFQFRFSRERQENDSVLVFRSDSKINAYLEKLAELAELPVEQVIRLSMEAYINKL